MLRLAKADRSATAIAGGNTSVIAVAISVLTATCAIPVEDRLETFFSFGPGARPATDANDQSRPLGASVDVRCLLDRRYAFDFQQEVWIGQSHCGDRFRRRRAEIARQQIGVFV